MAEKIIVRYSVEYECELEVSPEDDLEDVISDIDIPEGGRHNSRYVSDSFFIDIGGICLIGVDMHR